MVAGFRVAFDGVTKLPFRCLMPTATLAVPAISAIPVGAVAASAAPRLPTPRAVPALTPTIAPLGAERLIPVRYVREGEIAVRGPATGRHYRFRCGEAQEIPLADARVLVSEGDFAFSGGR